MNTDQRTRFFKVEPDRIRPLVTDTLWFDYSETAESYWDRLHLHHYHQLDIILSGEFVLTMKKGENQTGHPGDAWIIPPLAWHGVDCHKPYRICSFKFHLTPQFWPYFGTSFRRFRLPGYLCECVDAVGKYNSIPKTTTGEHVSALISLCLLECIHHSDEPLADSDALSDFRQNLWPLLEEVQLSPTARWSVAEMAGKMGLSLGHFTRSFRHIVGQTPQQYILETVMRNAAGNLLQTPILSIKQVAALAGYANVHAFTHAFTRTFNISPAAYRQQHHKPMNSHAREPHA